MTETAVRLGRLDAALRGAGFVVSAAHHIDAQQILIEFAGSTVDTARWEQITPYLAPIYCASEAQQAQFPDILAATWPDTPAPSNSPEEGRPGTIHLFAWRALVLPILASAVLLILAGLAFYEMGLHTVSGGVSKGSFSGTACAGCRVRIQRNQSVFSTSERTTETLTGKDGTFTAAVSRIDLPVEITAEAPGSDYLAAHATLTDLNVPLSTLVLAKAPPSVSAASVPPAIEPPVTRGQWQRDFTITLQPRMPSPFQTREVARLVPLRLVSLGLPLLLGVLWCLYWIAFRRAWLSLLPDGPVQGIHELSFSARQALVSALGWREVGHELRRRQPVPSPHLDIEATLETVLGHKGPPRLVYGTRVEPAYLVLIEEASPQDHLARLADELLLALESRDVAVQRFYFRDDPRQCAGPATRRVSRSEQLPVTALSDLLGAHRDHRLIVISDGRCLHDRVTGQPERWTRELALVRQPVLLTPFPEEAWTRREGTLFRLGFTVLPLSPAGLTRLGELYGSDRTLSAPSLKPASSATPPWKQDILPLMMPRPPAHLLPEELAGWLKRELGEEAYRLIQATSAYPEVQWALTARLGVALLSRRAALAPSLARLALLPWLRLGYMPQWLRGHLAGTQTEEDWSQTHRALVALLSRTGEEGSVPLSLSLPESPLWWPPAPSWRAGLRSLTHSQDADSRLQRDKIFLNFLQGPKKPATVITAPMRHLLFRDGLWPKGIRTLPVATGVLLITALLAFLLPPLQRTQQVSAGPPPTISALSLPPLIPTIPKSMTPQEVLQRIRQAIQMPKEPDPIPLGLARDFLSAVENDPHGDWLGLLQQLAAKEGANRVLAATTPIVARFSTGELLSVEDNRVFPVDLPAGEGAAGSFLLHSELFGEQDVWFPSEWLPARQTSSGGLLGESDLCEGVLSDASSVAVVSEEKIVRHLAGGKERRILSSALVATFDGCTVDGAYIVAWKNSSQGTQVWQARTDSLEKGFIARPGTVDLPIENALLSNDGRRLFALRKGGIDVLGPQGNEGRLEPAGPAFEPSSNGTQLAMASGNAISLWHVKWDFSSVPFETFRDCPDCPEMVSLPAGSFVMGSPEDEPGRNNDEGPQHRVQVQSFAIGKYDVTFDEWDACVKESGCKTRPSDSGSGRGRRPVINITWNDAQQYAAWLSRKTGHHYRLLSEAEWEYAGRAGTNTAYYWGSEVGKGHANCEGCGSQWDGRQTAPVGSFEPNSWGLYDMAGNVSTWTQDCYHKAYTGAPTDGGAWDGSDCEARRVVRGGSWNYGTQYVRVAYRSGVGEEYYIVGLRLARTS